MSYVTAVSEFRQARLGLTGEYTDMSYCIDPLTIYVGNIPKSATVADVAEAVDVERESVQLKHSHAPGQANFAFVEPESFVKSTFMLSESFKHERVITGRKLFLKQAYDRDQRVPSHKNYKLHKLSNEDFDLHPRYSEKPSIHCLDDDAMRHILGYLSLKEKLLIEVVCRRWQALIYSQVGNESTVDLNSESCNWFNVMPKHKGVVLSVVTTSIFKQDILVSEKENNIQDCKMIMYKMLLMNRDHLTALHLDEHRCFFDINIASAIGRMAPHLEVFSLRNSRRRHHYTSLRDIFSYCTKLKTFCLDGIDQTSQLFNELNMCKSLEVLRLSYISELNIRGQLRLQLKELSLCNVSCLELNIESLISPSLRIFRFFSTIEASEGPSEFEEEMLVKLIEKCPDLLELQVNDEQDQRLYYNRLKNLKALHVQFYDDESFKDQLTRGFPDVEVLTIEFFRRKILKLISSGDKISMDFSELPASIKSLTLPTCALDDASYDSLLAMPNLERVFFKRKTFSTALLKRFVSKTQIVEIGAGMAELRPHDVKALASLRKKAIIDAKRNASSEEDLDSLGPLVLHLPPFPIDCESTFNNPYIKVIELKGQAYLYDRVGSMRFDNEWLDFGNDFVQHRLGPQCVPEHDFDGYGSDVSDPLGPAWMLHDHGDLSEDFDFFFGGYKDYDSDDDHDPYKYDF